MISLSLSQLRICQNIILAMGGTLNQETLHKFENISHFPSLYFINAKLVSHLKY